MDDFVNLTPIETVGGSVISRRDVGAAVSLDAAVAASVWAFPFHVSNGGASNVARTIETARALAAAMAEAA